MLWSPAGATRLTYLAHKPSAYLAHKYAAHLRKVLRGELKAEYERRANRSRGCSYQSRLYGKSSFRVIVSRLSYPRLL